MGAAYLEQSLVTLLVELAPAFWDIAPEKQKPPFIVLNRTGEDPWRSINGPSGITQTTVQVDVYEKGVGRKVRLTRSIRQLLDGFTGIVETQGDTKKINGISLQNAVSFAIDKTDPDLYRDMLIFLITHKEPKNV